MNLIERLKTTKTYTPEELDADGFCSVAGKLDTPATRCILVSEETRDEIIALLTK